MKYLFLVLVTVFGLQANAITPESFFQQNFDLNKNGVHGPVVHSIPGSKDFFDLYKSINFAELYLFNFDLRYQIGSEWGKKPVTPEDMKADLYFARMASATARVRGGGTGFYLGEFNGRYIMATNHHVCPTESACSAHNAIYFPLSDLHADVLEFYGSWPEVDLSLFSIQLSDKQDVADALNAVASPFAFNHNVHKGEKLTTIGFGVADNPRGVMMGNRDSDCIVFSEDSEYKLMADPDDYNPADYKAWSFANGCDVSHGDSGSAMMDRDTGKVVGIIWTGKIPKNPKIQSSDYLKEIYNHPNEDVWKELSYSVPAVKMKEYLLKQINEGAISEGYVQTLNAVLQSDDK